MLPNERQVAAGLRRQHRDLLRWTARFHDFAVRPLLGGGLRGNKTRGIDRRVVLTGIGLYVRTLKQHRSAVTLAERGLGEDALAVTRHLFETTMAVAFLLRHRIILKAQGAVVKVKGYPLTTRFRARLYHANIAFEQDRTHRDFKNTTRLKRYARAEAGRTVAVNVAAAKNLIGPDWTALLTKTKSYSGVRLKDLALSLGLAPAYATAYRRCSWAVHPVYLVRYVEPGPRGEPSVVHLSPEGADVDMAIDTANVLLMTCLRFLNDRFGLGLDAGIRRHSKRLGLPVPKP